MNSYNETWAAYSVALNLFCPENIGSFDVNTAHLYANTNNKQKAQSFKFVPATANITRRDR